MSKELEKKVLDLLTVLKNEIDGGQSSPQSKARVEELIKVLEGRINQGIEGAGFGYSFRGFYDYFCREIGLQGVKLTPKGLEAWREVVDLANSKEVLGRITSPLR